MLYYSPQADLVVVRYRELVDKKYLEGLTASEIHEIEALSREIDAENEYFYRPILEGLTKAVSTRKLN
jgi:hypothetical protein